jgi:hypothetical protein
VVVTVEPEIVPPISAPWSVLVTVTPVVVTPADVSNANALKEGAVERMSRWLTLVPATSASIVGMSPDELVITGRVAEVGSPSRMNLRCRSSGNPSAPPAASTMTVSPACECDELIVPFSTYGASR